MAMGTDCPNITQHPAKPCAARPRRPAFLALARGLLDPTTTPHTNKMNTTELRRPYPDVSTVPSELSFQDSWDGEAVSELIRSKCDHGETPAFLFLGRKESLLLRNHLAESFGEEAVPTLYGTYYMGLDVITIDCESFIATGGRKVIRTLQDPTSRRPAWRDRETEALWQFRI